MLRYHAGKDVHAADAPPQFGVSHAIQIGTADQFAGGQTDLPGDVLCCARIVAGDHHHPDAGGVAFADRLRHRGPHRVRQADQADEFKREIMLFARKLIQLAKARPCHAEHAQAVLRHIVNLLRKLLGLRRCEMAQVRNSLGRPLGGDQVIVARPGLPDVRKGQQLA